MHFQSLFSTRINDIVISIAEEFCPLPPPPVNGQRHCSDWGPSGRFKVCSISCNSNLEFSQPVAKFYTCGAEGIWHPPSGHGSNLVFPACSGMLSWFLSSSLPFSKYAEM